MKVRTVSGEGVPVEKIFYDSYEQMNAALQKLQNRYPGMMQKIIRGWTADKREIVEVLLGNPEASFHLLIHAAMHGREYMNTAVVMGQMEAYLRRCQEEIYSDVCFHAMPMVNPDGVAISQTGVLGIRDKRMQKNIEKWRGREDFRRWKANAKGVDLNRNFDAFWEEYRGMERPAPWGYKGRAAFSEPETKAILQISREYSLDACISYHSSGNLIYWDYGARGKILEKNRRFAECMGKVTGYELRSTVSEGADAAGCSDYFVRKGKIPAVTIETGKGSCPLDEAEFEEIMEQNRDVWEKAVRFLKNFHMDG